MARARRARPAKRRGRGTVSSGTWTRVVVSGSDATVSRGISATQRDKCPAWWFSGPSTIILGASRTRPRGATTETLATWRLRVPPAATLRFARGFLVIACVRRFGGLHARRRERRVDVLLNGRSVDGFALRVVPPGHSDYFHRPPVPALPAFAPLRDCETIYAWPIRRQAVVHARPQRVSVRLDAGVRWDIDHVALLVQQSTVRNRVFLSHAWADKSMARALAGALADLGIGVWIDEGEMKVGDSLIRKISAAIDSVQYVAVLLSRSSVRSPWVQKELEIAMTQEIEHRRVKVLPIRLDDCRIPSYLHGKLYAAMKRRKDVGDVAAMIESSVSR